MFKGWPPKMEVKEKRKPYYGTCILLLAFNIGEKQNFSSHWVRAWSSVEVNKLALILKPNWKKKKLPARTYLELTTEDRETKERTIVDGKVLNSTHFTRRSSSLSRHCCSFRRELLWASLRSLARTHLRNKRANDRRQNSWNQDATEDAS